jgi:hypothetical protein
VGAHPAGESAAACEGCPAIGDCAGQSGNARENLQECGGEGGDVGKEDRVRPGGDCGAGAVEGALRDFEALFRVMKSA